MTMNYENLLRRGIVGLKHIGPFRYENGDEPHSLDCTLAGRVAHVFGTGMTKACLLCRWAGENPDYKEQESSEGEN